MAARAIWKGKLLVGEQAVPVKMYSAVQDRNIHFRLVHAKDLAPVEQKIVRKTDGREVPREERRKAYPVGDDTAVVIQPEELEKIEPGTSREISLCRFVPAKAISDQWYDRPYYLGPDEDDGPYFALAAALEAKAAAGVARWVMRRKRYVGALRAAGGYLMMITLRRAEQVLSVAIEEPAAKPDAKELKLAAQLVDSVAGDFDAGLWQDEYRERVRQLIEAKRRGEPVKARAPKRKRVGGDLSEQLRRSITAMTEKKVA